MPIYVYQCTRCQRHDIEEMQRIGADPPERASDCPNADGPCPLKRQVTTASLKFDGFGWGGWEPSADGKTQVRILKGKATDNYGD